MGNEMGRYQLEWKGIPMISFSIQGIIDLIISCYIIYIPFPVLLPTKLVTLGKLLLVILTGQGLVIHSSSVNPSFMKSSN
jgi:hypothetical protein